MRYTGGFGSFSVTALRPTTWYWRMATICTQAMRRQRQLSFRAEHSRRSGRERRNTAVLTAGVNSWRGATRDAMRPDGETPCRAETQQRVCVCVCVCVCV